MEGFGLLHDYGNAHVVARNVHPFFQETRRSIVPVQSLFGGSWRSRTISRVGSQRQHGSILISSPCHHLEGYGVSGMVSVSLRLPGRLCTSHHSLYRDCILTFLISLCISVWTSASALLSLGFSVKETFGVVVLSRVVMIALSLGNGWIGGEWHIGYCVAQR